MPPAHDDILAITHGPLVLVVDDESAVRSDVCRLIRGFGYPVLLLEPEDPQVADLAPGYHDLPSLRKPVTFGDLYRKVQDLIGPPTGPPAERRGRPRPRRRSSGHHTV